MDRPASPPDTETPPRPPSDVREHQHDFSRDLGHHRQAHIKHSSSATLQSDSPPGKRRETGEIGSALPSSPSSAPRESSAGRREETPSPQQEVRRLEQLHRSLQQEVEMLLPRQLGDSSLSEVDFSDHDWETIDGKKLLREPKNGVPLPPKLWTPDQFICPAGWLNALVQNIKENCTSVDDSSNCVPAMGLGRCSQGGKTRLLHEVADILKQEGTFVLFVSFSDFFAINKAEQKDLLEALCLRIAFALWTDGDNSSIKTYRDRYVHFRKNYDISPMLIVKWLETAGSRNVVLLIDELDNQSLFSTDESRRDAQFAQFVEQNFLAKEGRYLVFTSHSPMTKDYFKWYADRSSTGQRKVILRPLPRAEKMGQVVDLNQDITSVRQALYYGQIPGLLHDQRDELAQSGKAKRDKAMELYNDNAAIEPDNQFRKLLRSPITGELEHVPAPLHGLLDASGEHGIADKVRWIPCHIRFVLRKVLLHTPSLAKLAEDMSTLCKTVFTAKEESGIAFEALFALMLLVRCCGCLPDGHFLPKTWFDGSEQVRYNHFIRQYIDEDGGRRLLILNECKKWDDIRLGIDHSAQGQTIDVFYPQHSKFEVVDVLVAYSKDGSVEECHGFQLKEGSSLPSASDAPIGQAFTHCFWLMGQPPAESSVRENWIVPSEDEINAFLGESGQLWTPKKWADLSATLWESMATTLEPMDASEPMDTSH